MAKHNYSADSAPAPPPRLVFEFRSDVTGLPTASGTATAGTSLPNAPSSIG